MYSQDFLEEDYVFFEQLNVSVRSNYTYEKIRSQVSALIALEDDIENNFDHVLGSSATKDMEEKMVKFHEMANRFLETYYSENNERDYYVSRLKYISAREMCKLVEHLSGYIKNDSEHKLVRVDSVR